MKHVLALLALLVATSCSPDEQGAISGIRRDVYARTDVAADTHLLIEAYPHTYAELTAIYDANKGGVWCSGAAYTLQRAYSEAGFHSWVLSYGFRDQGLLTHASTLVQVGNKIFLQDAYLDFDYAAPLFDVLDALKAVRPLSPRIDVGDRDVLVEESGRQTSWAVSDPSRCQRLSVASPMDVCRSRANLSLFVSRFMTTTGVPTLDYLQQLGKPRDLRYLLLYPYGLFDGHQYYASPDQNSLFAEIVRHTGSVESALPATRVTADSSSVE